MFDDTEEVANIFSAKISNASVQTCNPPSQPTPNSTTTAKVHLALESVDKRGYHSRPPHEPPPLLVVVCTQ